MTKQTAKNILALLERVTIQGKEVHTYNQIVNELREIIVLESRKEEHRGSLVQHSDRLT